ncbi:MAG: glycosyltransferase [Chromatiaceae bacterium]|nr:MAG: glycosyltransferase [Chromatiaceae bacterium]
MTLNLARGLLDLGRPVDLVLARASGPYLAQAREQAQDQAQDQAPDQSGGRAPPELRLVDLDRPRVLAALPGLVRYLRRRRPRALLAAMDHANLIALWAVALAGTGTRCLVSVRSNLSAESAHANGLAGRLLLPLARRFYPRASAVIAVSAGVADDLQRHLRLAPGRLQVIHNPVLTPDLPALAAAPPPHPWFGDGGLPVLLAAGRLAPQKDYPTLLEAFARVRRVRPARLLILGEGPQRAALAARIQALGLTPWVDLPGFTPNPFCFMRAARLFVLASAWEGLPGVLIQAMACGTPVVSTDCPSGPREVLADGAFGALVPVGDPAALAAAILATLERPPDPARLRARAADFALAPISRRYLDLLDPAIDPALDPGLDPDA